ncbi:unnamed protein product [Cyprideis torosa]|uniref:Uncharacterized protein n=1 Tax=Cyprideis torosa TaxID=163714 RepID=A0A7R8WR55_9CRUS|nr:unnamed protein product [Cyprideis torosa]CAG0908514.1 unnamed protein product [Cyprideis torosa]
MNKSELIESLAQDMNLPHSEAAAITNTLIDTMTKALANGENIEIRGFGSFVIKHYDSYEGRNPKTGKKIKVKAKRLPFFKVGKDLREQMPPKKPRGSSSLDWCAFEKRIKPVQPPSCHLLYPENLKRDTPWTKKLFLPQAKCISFSFI